MGSTSSNGKRSTSCVCLSGSQPPQSGTPPAIKRSLSAEDILSRGSSLLNIMRANTKRMNEMTYMTYNLFDASSLLSRSRSLSEDLLLFTAQVQSNIMKITEAQVNNSVGAVDSEEEYRVLMTQIASLEALVRVALRTYRDSSDLIVQSVQFIEHIETVEQRDKKQIRQLGLKNQLDSVQFDLNEASEAFEAFILSKFPTNSIAQLSNINLTLASLKQRIFQSRMISSDAANRAKIFMISEGTTSDIRQEIPCELAQH